MLSKNARCCEKWMKDYHYVQCSRKATLEHQGKPYCKQHHPPSIAARRENERKCEYVGSIGKCDTRVPNGVKYCSVHESFSVPTDELAELRKDKARLDWLDTEWGREMAGKWRGHRAALYRRNMPITRADIDANMKEFAALATT